MVRKHWHLPASPSASHAQDTDAAPCALIAWTEGKLRATCLDAAGKLSWPIRTLLATARAPRVATYDKADGGGFLLVVHNQAPKTKGIKAFRIDLHGKTLWMNDLGPGRDFAAPMKRNPPGFDPQVITHPGGEGTICWGLKLPKDAKPHKAVCARLSKDGKKHKGDEIFLNSPSLYRDVHLSRGEAGATVVSAALKGRRAKLAVFELPASHNSAKVHSHEVPLRVPMGRHVSTMAKAGVILHAFEIQVAEYKPMSVGVWAQSRKADGSWFEHKESFNYKTDLACGSPSIVGDGTHGWLATSCAKPMGRSALHIAKMTILGGPLWDDRPVTVLQRDPYRDVATHIESDGKGGAVAVMFSRSLPAGQRRDLYIVHVDGAGKVLWGSMVGSAGVVAGTSQLRRFSKGWVIASVMSDAKKTNVTALFSLAFNLRQKLTRKPSRLGNDVSGVVTDFDFAR